MRNAVFFLQNVPIFFKKKSKEVEKVEKVEKSVRE